MGHGTCGIDGCAKPAKSRCWCSMHYERWRTTGTTDLGPRPSRRRYALNEAYFDIVDTPEKAYWLGFLGADGCVLECGAVRVGLAAADENHLAALRDAVGSTSPIGHYLATLNGKTYPCVALTLHSGRLVQVLGGYGLIPRKSLVLEPWAGPSHLMPHYWRGLVDGDGTVMAKPGQWEIRLIGSRAVVGGFERWVKGMLPRAAGRSVQIGAIWRFRVRGRVLCRALASILYGDDCPVALERKAERAAALVAAGPPRRLGHPTSPETRLLLSRVAGRPRGTSVVR